MNSKLLLQWQKMDLLLYGTSISMCSFVKTWKYFTILLSRLQFIRSIERPSICNAPIYLGAISPTLGDIVTIHIIDPDTQLNSNDNLSTNECLEATESGDDDFVNVPMEMDGKSVMRLHSINAKYISHITIPEQIKCVCYSYIKEGTGINVIGTGFDCGIVRLWSSWDLTVVKEINVGSMNVIRWVYYVRFYMT